MVNLKNFNWATGLFIISYHLLLVILLPIYLSMRTPSLGLIIAAVVIGIIANLTITTGYHRLFAHQAYTTNSISEGSMLGLGALAVQGSALEWAHDHRLHHQYVDTEKDPYSIKKGFWHAHMGWLFKKGEGVDEKVVPDLMKKKAVIFQHKHYVSLMILANLAVVLLAGWIFHDLFGALVIVFLARLFLTHHTGWFINSWAHMFGSKPYSKEHSAVNNAMLALFTFGEGYHNYHHTFPADYRNGVRWYQYDPTKIVIWCLAKIRVAKNLKRVELPLIKRKMILEDQRVVLEKIKALSSKKWREMEEQIKRIAESLNAKLLEKYALMVKYRMRKKEERKEMKLRLKALQRNIREEYKIWIRICSKVLARKPQVSA